MPKLPIGDDKESAETCKKVLKNNSFFSVLQTDEGFLSVQSFLVSHQKLYLDQITFQNILLNIVEEYDEFEAVEIFDILETTGDGTITIKEFYVFTLLQAAVENDQTLQCLYYHGNLIFSVISGDQNYINGDRLESILRVVGLEEMEIYNKMQEFGINSDSMISDELFQLLLFSIFKENNPTMIDFEISEEEMKMMQPEEGQQISKDYESKNYQSNSPNKVGSATRAHDEVMEFVDPFNETPDSQDEYEGRKEVTNMPMNHGEYDSNPYASKGYSTRPLSTSKNHLIGKNDKEGMTKY